MMGSSQHMNIKAISLNVNSLININRRHYLNNFICKQMPDFVMVSETKVNRKHKMGFQSYDTYRNDRHDDAGGGTAVLCKKKYKTEHVICDNSISSFEYTMVKVHMNNSEILYVIALYKPPKKKLKSSDLNRLINLCGHSKFIIGGDFNSKHRAWSNNINDANGNILYEWLSSHNVCDRVNMLTGTESTCDRRQNSFIDLFIFDKNIVNNYFSDSYNQLAVLPYLSDHGAVVFGCVINSISVKEINYKYNYKNVNWNDFNRKIESKLEGCDIPINRNLSPDEIDNIANDLQSILCNCVDEKIKKVPRENYTYIDESNQTKSLKHNLIILQRRKKRARNPSSLNEINNSIKLIKNMIANSLTNDYRQF